MAEININIAGSGMSFVEQTMRDNIKTLISYVDANCSKKITAATIKNDELTIEVYGGLDDSQIERIQDNFRWIDGLVYNDDKLVVLSLDI